MTAGNIYTVAGDGTEGFTGDRGPAASAELNSPDGAVTDAVGNLVINDPGNSKVRVVAASTGTFYGQSMTAGDSYTIAGNGKDGFSGDRGLATAAELNQPYGIAVDGNGSTVIADQTNGWVRVAAAATGTFYGQAMTAGDIYTIAKSGAVGCAFGIAVDPPATWCSRVLTSLTIPGLGLDHLADLLVCALPGRILRTSAGF
jgi:hypothetical protein